MRKSITGTNTVEAGLIVKFNTDVETYVNLLQKSLSGETLFGNKVPMPAGNLMTITASAIQASVEVMAKNGVNRARAKSVSKYVFNNSLEAKMLELGL